MSDLQKAFPPIETRDEAPAVCLAVAILGLVVGGLVVAARMQSVDVQTAINISEPAPSSPQR